MEPQKGSQLHDTERKKPQVSQDKLNRHTKGGSARAYVTPRRRRKKKTQHRCYRKKNPKHKNRDHQRRWPAAKTPKASHLRRERERRIGRRSKKGNAKNEA